MSSGHENPNLLKEGLGRLSTSFEKYPDSLNWSVYLCIASCSNDVSIDKSCQMRDSTVFIYTI